MCAEVKTVQNITIQSKNRIFAILSVFLLMILFIFNITKIRSDITVQIAIYFGFAGIALLTVFMRKRITHYTVLLVYFSVYSIMITVFSQAINISTLIINFGYITLWIWVIIVFSYANENNGFSQRMINLLTIFAIPMGIYLMFNFAIQIDLEDWGYANNNYYLLCLIPIIMLCNNKIIRRIAILVAVLTVLASLKRTGILALCTMGAFITIYNTRNKPNFYIKTFFIVLAFAILAVNYYSLSQMLGFDAFSRFDTISEDAGSGRGIIYKNWFRIISESDIIRLLFGCGYNGMMNFHNYPRSAHNDFMEIMIDYGILGFVVYIGIIWRYIKVCIYNIKHSTIYATSCIAALCAFIFLSLFSHCVIYPSYFMFILIFWTYVEAKTKELKLTAIGN